ncbi:hypothetical protein I79_022789 [Cricetulus griseus]|uniref:Uncharacterized protein n=1 Tax=Cricetulus griseus TaxID=10029 RepID=G3IGA6_CRIGR|nr:hypothetical protein I79_022789 [Cricetulus griseus]
MSLGDLYLPLICCMVAWRRAFHPPITEAGGRAGPEVIRRAACTLHQLQHLGEQALHLASAAQWS